MKVLFIAAVGSLIARATAHGGVKAYSINDIWYDGWDNIMLVNRGEISLQRAWTSSQPITDPTTKDIVCNNPGSPSHMTAIVRPKNRITAYWDKTFDHPNGPLIVWMTECGPRGSCSRMTRLKGLDWFKIAQVGLESGTVGNGKWGAASMMANNFSHTSVIPNSLPDGDYLIRHEIIALDSKPTAYYVQCAQLTVFSDGGEFAGDEWRVKIPGVYKTNDTNLSIPNLKSDTRVNYTIPGPPVYPGLISWATVEPPDEGRGHSEEIPAGQGPLKAGNPKSSGPPKGFPKGFGPRSGGQQAAVNPKDLAEMAHPNARTENVEEEMNHPTALYVMKDGGYVLGYGGIGWRA